MRASLAFFIAAVAAAAAAVPAKAADRTYSMTSFEKIRVDGPYDVKVATGVSPYARASGDWAAIDQLVMSVEGHTLVIRPPAGSDGQLIHLADVVRKKQYDDKGRTTEKGVDLKITLLV